MKNEYMRDYLNVKNQYEREVNRLPEKEHELTLMYSPVLNYHAVKYIEQAILDKNTDLIPAKSEEVKVLNS